MAKAGNNALRRWLLIGLLALAALMGGMPVASAGADIELDGMLIDRTITRFGKDFLYYYGNYWRDLPGTQGFTVTVYETVYPQAGTRLWILINQTKVYETYFGRRHNNMKQRADDAMLITIDHVAQVKADIMLGHQDQRW